MLHLMTNDNDHAASSPRRKYAAPWHCTPTGSASPKTYREVSSIIFGALTRAGCWLGGGQLAGGRGVRCYIAVAGGLATPSYLGSRATFPGGRLGGTQARIAATAFR